MIAYLKLQSSIEIRAQVADDDPDQLTYYSKMPPTIPETCCRYRWESGSVVLVICRKITLVRVYRSYSGTQSKHMS